MQAFQKLEPVAQKHLIRIFLTALLFWMGTAILLPTIPTHLEDVGFNQGEIGLIIGAYALGLLLVRPFLGQLADTKGRLTVLLIGSLVAATAPLGYLAFYKFWPLFGLRAYHGLSIAAFTTAYIALAADLSPPDQRGQIMGYMSLANPIGVAIGPAIAGFLLGTADSYTAIFLISAGLGLASFWLGCTLHEKPLVVSHQPQPSAFGAIWQTLTVPALAVPTGVLFLVGFPFGALHTFIPLYLKSAGNILNPGLFYTAAALASFVARFAFGRLTDRYGRGIFIFLSLLSYGLAMGLLAIARTDTLFLIAACLEGLSLGTLIPTTIALLTDRCPSHLRGTVFSISIAGLDLGIAIAAPVFGSLAKHYGYPWIFWVSTGLVGLAAMLFLLCCNSTIRSSLRFSLGLECDRFIVQNTD